MDACVGGRVVGLRGMLATAGLAANAAAQVVRHAGTRLMIGLVVSDPSVFTLETNTTTGMVARAAGVIL